EAVHDFDDGVPSEPRPVLLRTDHPADTRVGAGNERLFTFGTHADGRVVLVAQLLEQLLIALVGPFVFARHLKVVEFLAEFVFFAVAHDASCTDREAAVPGGSRYSISLISLPVRAFSTVSSNLGPRSTPICCAR